MEELVCALVLDAVSRYHDSVSAEHGVGGLKVDKLPSYKDPRPWT